MEKRFEGRDPLTSVVLAERISGVGSVAHALAYCQAVEAAAKVEVPQRSQHFRILLAELERLYNHRHYLGHLADTTTLKVGQAQGKLLEERAKQLNAQLTGSRFLRGLLVPGGLRCELSPDPQLAQALGALQHDVNDYVRALERTSSYRDRLHDTGVLDQRTAFDQGATGPVERASGLDRDLRRDHSYAGYADVDLRVPVETGGDAYARARVRAEEIDVSFEIMLRLLPAEEDIAITIDYGRCVVCQLCTEVCPNGALAPSDDWAFGVRRREDLLWRQATESPTGQKLPQRLGAFRRSLHIRHVDAGSCNGCESELQALNNPFYNLHRLGIFFTPSPRFADLLLVTGSVTAPMREPLLNTYQAMPESRLVMACGTCAVSGGVSGGGYYTGCGLDGLLPVDLYLPGCPPNPAALIEGLLMLLARRPQRVQGGRIER